MTEVPKVSAIHESQVRVSIVYLYVGLQYNIRPGLNSKSYSKMSKDALGGARNR